MNIWGYKISNQMLCEIYYWKIIITKHRLHYTPKYDGEKQQEG